VRAVEWRGDWVRILDQRALPREERFIEARSADEVAEAVRTMAVRGAPLLGIVAAFGLALAARTSRAGGPRGVLRDLRHAGRILVGSRPTAINIAWAVERVLAAAERAAGEGVEAVRAAAEEEANSIAVDDERSCLAIGRLGAELVPEDARILTHCNTGALATGGIGTAMGVIATSHDAGKRVRVWVDETRPVLQGARLTAWELQRLGIPMTLIADSAAGSVMARSLVDLVVVGADRIAANGDVANKIGTYQLAVLARHHGIPFYVAAPVSTIDLQVPSGDLIVIEEREASEIVFPLGVSFAPPGIPVANPAFDVTPARLVTAIVTDQGIARPPYRTSLRRVVAGRAGRERRSADRIPTSAAAAGPEPVGRCHA
jgi:methylthioribose-1-phosphate isomerase